MVIGSGEEEFDDPLTPAPEAVLYEEWATSICKLVDPNFEKAADLLQFPASKPRKQLAIKTWKAWKSAIDANPSALIASEFQPALQARYAPKLAVIESLLRWYRFFKECRNTRVHAGGLHTKASVEAYDAAKVNTLKTCGLSRDLALSHAPVVGQAATMGMRNALLGLALVSRLANAFDALLCHSPACEAYLLGKLTVASKAIGRVPSASPAKRENHIRAILGKAQVPLPTNYFAIDSYLKAHSLIKF